VWCFLADSFFLAGSAPAAVTKAEEASDRDSASTEHVGPREFA